MDTMNTQPPDTDTVRATALLLGPLVFGILQQLIAEPPARAWHNLLNKSPYKPPNVVFAVVWTWSYLSLGYSSYLVYVYMQEQGVSLNFLVALYGVHLVLLNLWNVIFFSARRIDYALGCLLLIDTSAGLLMGCTAAVVPFAAALCVPYFFWLLFLTHLNVYMYSYNFDHAHLMSTPKTRILEDYQQGASDYSYSNNSQVVPQFKEE